MCFVPSEMNSSVQWRFAINSLCFLPDFER
jgi:hypothetical protein